MKQLQIFFQPQKIYKYIYFVSRKRVRGSYKKHHPPHGYFSCAATQNNSQSKFTHVLKNASHFSPQGSVWETSASNKNFTAAQWYHTWTLISTCLPIEHWLSPVMVGRYKWGHWWLKFGVLTIPFINKYAFPMSVESSLCTVPAFSKCS